MTKKTAFLYFFLALLVFNLTYSQPAATIQLTGGYSVPLPDLKGDFGSTRYTFTANGNPDSNTYFMKSGINYGIVLKVPISRKNLPINFIGTLLINSFNNSTEYDDTAGYTTINLNQTITTFGVGLEYSFAGKKTKIYPYISAEFIANLFSGKYSENNDAIALKLFHTMRGGFQFTAGLDYVVQNNVGVTLGARYSFANIIGKNSGKDTPSNYYLNDAEHEDLGAMWASKNITYLQFFGGVSFYFGR